MRLTKKIYYVTVMDIIGEVEIDKIWSYTPITEGQTIQSSLNEWGDNLRNLIVVKVHHVYGGV